MIKYCDDFQENLKLIKKMYEESGTNKIESFHVFEHRIHNIQQIEREKRDLAKS